VAAFASRVRITGFGSIGPASCRYLLVVGEGKGGDVETVQAKMLRWVKTPRGAATLTVGTLAAIKSVVDSGLAAFPTAVIIYVTLAVALVYGAAHFWETKTSPSTPTFARPRNYSTQGRRLKEDANARMWRDRGGFLFERRVYFMATGLPPVRLRLERAAWIQANKYGEPAQVIISGGRTWWAFGDAYFWETAGYQSKDVLALLRDRERRHDQELRRAHMLINAENSGKQQRYTITKEMQRLVYERDGGVCQQCESRFNIQYDHMIPVALGGATSIDNLQLLCQDCNLRKSATI
jgi:hypothetical protein